MSRQVVFLLKELEFTLQRLQLWQDDAPSEAALASTQPFALDTLEFHQWLQFIMLERFRVMWQKVNRYPLRLQFTRWPLKFIKIS